MKHHIQLFVLSMTLFSPLNSMKVFFKIPGHIRERNNTTISLRAYEKMRAASLLHSIYTDKFCLSFLSDRNSSDIPFYTCKQLDADPEKKVQLFFRPSEVSHILILARSHAATTLKEEVEEPDFIMNLDEEANKIRDAAWRSNTLLKLMELHYALIAKHEEHLQLVGTIQKFDNDERKLLCTTIRERMKERKSYTILSKISPTMTIKELISIQNEICAYMNID